MAIKEEMDKLLQASPDDIIKDAIREKESLFTGPETKYADILEQIIVSLYQEPIQTIETARTTQFRGGAIPEAEAKKYSESIEPLRKRQAELLRMIHKNGQKYSVMITDQLEFARKTTTGKPHG